MNDRCPIDGRPADERVRRDQDQIVAYRCPAGHFWTPEGVMTSNPAAAAAAVAVGQFFFGAGGIFESSPSS